MNIEVEQIATYGFACIVALMLLRFFLGDLRRKLDCIKDAVIDLAKRIEKMEDKRGE